MTSLGELLEADHARLDDLWDRATSGWKDEPDRSAALFREFSDGLLRHIQVEEDLLFPFYADRGEPAGRQFVQFLVEEHGEIRSALSALLRKVEGRASDVVDEETVLRNVLWAHNTREEGLLYPWFDAERSVGTARSLADEIRTRLAPAPEPE